MKKVGVLTHFYNSLNYGGLLQAFALVSVLKNSGIDAYQIQYDALKEKRNVLFSFLHFIHLIIKNITKSKQEREREKECRLFRNSVSHTSKVYSYKTIKDVDDEFDAFITGSDQVWNPNIVNSAYLLSFTNKLKFSYAASIASDQIPTPLLQMYTCSISCFKSVSVREKKAAELLYPIHSTVVLDPVFLYPSEDWKKLASKPKKANKYIFCYFLGDTATIKDNIFEISQKYNYEVVGLKKSFDLLSPNDFLSLILYSDFVLTDSFHAICFSYIFKKSFYVFERIGGSHMNTRIEDILLCLNCQERYIKSVNCFEKIDYMSKDSSEFEKINKESFDFFNRIVKEIKNEN